MTMHQQARLLISRNRQRQKNRQESMVSRLAIQADLLKEIADEAGDHL